MNSASGTTEANTLNQAARRRLLAIKGEPLFYSDWVRVVFIHYEVEREALQNDLPYPLDLHQGKAYVSLVAFSMRRLRPRLGGRLAAWLLAPIATHEFLNVRTYVRHQDEPGIYFLAEWLSNPLSVHLGPGTFGLPYRFGDLRYRHHHEHGELLGSVISCKMCLAYSAVIRANISFHLCADGSLEEFLMERYTAYTRRASQWRFFRIWHPPWPQTSIEVAMQNTSLLTTNWPWFKGAELVGANYSPGLTDVWMGRPQRLTKRRQATPC